MGGGIHNQYSILYSENTSTYYPPYKFYLDDYSILYDLDSLFNNLNGIDGYNTSYIKDNRFNKQVDCRAVNKYPYVLNMRYNKQATQAYQWNKLKF